MDNSEEITSDNDRSYSAEGGPVEPEIIQWRVGAHEDGHSKYVEFSRSEFEDQFEAFARQSVLRQLGLEGVIYNLGEVGSERSASNETPVPDLITWHIDDAGELIKWAISQELPTSGTSADSDSDERTHPTPGLASIFDALEGLGYGGDEWKFGDIHPAVSPDLAYPDLLDNYVWNLKRDVMEYRNLSATEVVVMKAKWDAMKAAASVALDIFVERAKQNLYDLVIWDDTSFRSLQPKYSRLVSRSDLERLRELGLAVLVTGDGDLRIFPEPGDNSDEVMKHVFEVVIMYSHGQRVLQDLVSIRGSERFISKHGKIVLFVGLLTGKLMTIAVLTSVGQIFRIARTQREINAYLAALSEVDGAIKVKVSTVG
jgi:hypothetical protein